MSSSRSPLPQVAGGNNPIPPMAEEVDEEMDFGEYLAILLSAKWFILAVFFIALFAGWFYAFISVPIYRSDALVQVEESRQGLSSLEDANAMLFGSETALSAEMEILKSRMVLGQVVDELKLDVEARPHYFPIIGEALARRFGDKKTAVAAPWFELGKYAWGGELIDVDSLTVPEDWLDRWLTLVTLKDGKFRIQLNDAEVLGEGDVGRRVMLSLKNGGSIELFVSHIRAREGTEFVLTRHTRMRGIAALLANLGVAERGRQSKVLELSLTGPEPEKVREALNAVANTYLRQNVERRSAEAEHTLAFLDKQLPALKAQLDASTNALNAYRMDKGSLDLTKETQDVLNQVVTLESELIALRQKREEARQKFKPEHPSVRALDAQLVSLEQELVKQDQKVHKLPETQQVVLRLSRDVEVSSTVYTSLLNSAQELRIAKAGTIGNVRIIDYAIEPTTPIRPQKATIVATSGFAGIILGCILVFFWYGLKKGIEDPQIIENRLQLPVYAAIPLSEGQRKIARKFRRKGNETAETDKSLLLALDQPDDLAVESIRSLRTTLHFALLDKTNNIILVTGSRPGVGKTFLVSNLAMVLGESKKKILVIDADMRRGCVHRYFGIERNRGLSEWISSNKAAGEEPEIYPFNGIDVIPTGAIPPNPSELLLDERFVGLLNHLKTRYDYIIIDSPPILAVTDPAIIGRLAGATLIVMQSGLHDLRELHQAVKRMQHAGANVRGFVMNKVSIVGRKYAEGYGYGKYVYQYRYSK